VSNEKSEVRPGADGLRPEDEARRDFLTKAGRFAAVTAPTITLLLGTSLSSRAIAQSVSPKPGYGFGDENHVHTGPPGQVGNENSKPKGPNK